jgi:uncharacterized Zn-finger protein
MYVLLLSLPHTWLYFRFYRCVKCKSKFSSPESLDHHMAISTHSYPCPHCGKIFACERYLRRHLPTHGTAQSFTCQQCGKGFRTEQYLNTHMLTHSTHKPHVCQVWTWTLFLDNIKKCLPEGNCIYRILDQEIRVLDKELHNDTVFRNKEIILNANIVVLHNVPERISISIYK